MSESLVYKKAFHFSIDIVNFYKTLLKDKKEYILSKQLLRCGTSVGANIKEALDAQSKPDFLSKMNIALKEASEVEYWLDLLKSIDYLDEKLYRDLMSQCIELNRMLSAIVKTVKCQVKQIKDFS
ncbi:four helix bundle protein [Clostridium aciditolerans]|uniref:Four helix bundle protein n=1 Tax=Clostridium aciditolerans TaxID=339861 RepID=A0A934HR10_9CLOT|nr:four helix bundle protein [Clostridium aciditolerans]MBI6872735.1 four helix bundle protein [Clostridium aciditolerans]